MQYSYNNLVDKSKIPDDASSFNCYWANLSKLPELPIILQYLICSHNKLVELPKLPDGLKNLGCIYNNLTELPELPKSIIGLNCYNNKLVELPELPDGLKNLDCGNNKLVELPKLPINIAILRFAGNNIKYLSPHNCSVIKNINCFNLSTLYNPVSSGFDRNEEFQASL